MNTFSRSRSRLAGVAVMLASAGCATNGMSQPTPQADVDVPIQIRYAVVTQVQPVQVKSDVGRNSLVGGILGLAIGAVAGGSEQDVALGAAGGAALAGITTKIKQGSSQAVSYMLRYADGSVVKVVTEDDHLDVGDCAAVEIGGTTNLRRVAQSMCQPPLNHPVEQELAARSQVQAADCDAAKKQLLAAETTADVDAATKKVQVLCQN